MQVPDWDKVDEITYNSMMTKRSYLTKKQMQKYDRLAVSPKPTPVLDTKRTVTNLSNHQLSSVEIAVLSKGANYAVAPTTIPFEEIISNIESGIRSLPTDAAEEIRRDASRILHRAKPPKSNLTATEKTALKNLKSNKDILILSADKGNATVVLNTSDYQKKVEDILDPQTYTKLPRDPTARILRQTNLLLKNSSIPEEKQRSIRISEALPPRLYGLPKIHKPEVPLRPIVSAIGSPTYAVSKYLCNILKPHTGQTNTYIRDSMHFIEKLKSLTLQPEDLLISFDVVSLFTMVPVNETMALLRDIFPDDITALFKHVLTTTYFLWNGEFYEQNDGVAMGNPLSPVVANLYMESFETTALNTAPLKPKCWFRYVDDTFVVWSHGEDTLNDFLDHLNRVHPRIQFTMEKERDDKLAFLDVLVTKNADGSLGHTVYRKPTHTDRYLHKMSNHHPSQKRAMMKTLVNRATRICENDSLPEELSHLNRALQANGYSAAEVKRALHPKETSHSETNANQTLKVSLPYVKNITDRIGKVLGKHNVKAIFKPTSQLRNLFRSAKDRRDPLSSAGVYRIPCSCGAVYIGTTQRSINTRLSEHKRNCRFGYTEKSAVAEHAFSGREHNIRFEDVDVLATTAHYHARLNREAIEIHKHPRNFNRKEEAMKINPIWIPVIHQAKAKPNEKQRRASGHVGTREHDNSHVHRVSVSATSPGPSQSIAAPRHSPAGINIPADRALPSVTEEPSRRILRPRPHRH